MWFIFPLMIRLTWLDFFHIWFFTQFIYFYVNLYTRFFFPHVILYTVRLFCRAYLRLIFPCDSLHTILFPTYDFLHGSLIFTRLFKRPFSPRMVLCTVTSFWRDSHISVNVCTIRCDRSSHVIALFISRLMLTPALSDNGVSKCTFTRFPHNLMFFPSSRVKCV